MDPQNNYQNQYGGYGPQQGPAPMPPQTAPAQEGGVPMSVINAVNANGTVTGDKVVSYIWKRIGICSMIIAAALLIGIGISVIIMNNIN